MLKTKEISINKELYTIKQSFKSLLLFEEMTSKNIANISENLTDTLKLFYCMLSASNENFKISFEKFIELLDENENTLQSFNSFINELNPKPSDKKKV